LANFATAYHIDACAVSYGQEPRQGITYTLQLGTLLTETNEYFLDNVASILAIARSPQSHAVQSTTDKIVEIAESLLSTCCDLQKEPMPVLS
jgi:hypothetical protein